MRHSIANSAENEPSSRDIATCRPWLEAELHLVELKLASFVSVQLRGRQSLARVFALRKNAAKFSSRSLRPAAAGLSQPFILPRSYVSPMKKPANVNTKTSWPICAQP